MVTDRETDNVLSISNIRVTNGDGQGISVDGNLNSLDVSPSAYGYLTGSQSAVIELEYDISDGTNTITNTVTVTIAGLMMHPLQLTILMRSLSKELPPTYACSITTTRVTVRIRN